MFEDLPVDKQIGPITDRKCFIYIVIRDQDADIPEFQPCYNRLNILYGNGIHTRKRFVQQYEFGVHRKGTRDLRPPPLTAAKRVAVILAHMMQVELIQERL